MPKYLTLSRLTPDGLRGLMTEGAARMLVAEQVLAGVGGKVLGSYVIADGDWDTAIISEFPETAAADHGGSARMIAAFKTGGVAEMRVFRLATMEEFASASRAAEEAYVPPKVS